MTALRDIVARRVVPSAVVALSQVDWPARHAAALRRAAGRRGRVELFFAFDDACSAVAVIDVARRLDGHAAEVVPLPVVRRGIREDPAAEAKRRYAIADARRRARRLGLELSRGRPVDAQATATLAAWVAATAPRPELLAFCVDALHQLWFAGDGPVRPAQYEALWRRHVGAAPVADDAAVRRNERRMRRRGPYDTPAAVVGGWWSFAHDRPAQVVARVEALGWT